MAVAAGLGAYQMAQNREQTKVDLACSYGETQHHRHEYAKAIEYYDEALALKPDYVKALLGKAEVHCELQEWSKAIAAYERAATLQPDDPRPHGGLGQTYYRMRLPGKAADAYLQAIERGPEEGIYKYCAGLCYYENKNWEAAAGVYREYLKKAPRDAKAQRDHANARCNLGHCLVELGREEEAREQARELEGLGESRAAQGILARLKKKP